MTIIAVAIVSVAVIVSNVSIFKKAKVDICKVRIRKNSVQ